MKKIRIAFFERCCCRMSNAGIESYAVDASPSWHGYNYQGQVGLYVALRKLSEISEAEIPNYELELEWFEDFCIKKDGEYESIHQVKTYSTGGTAKYKDAIWLLLAKLLDFPTIEIAYLHVSKQVSREEDLKEDIANYTPPKKESSNREYRKVNQTTPAECYEKVKSSGKYDDLFDSLSLYKYHDGEKFSTFNNIEKLIKDVIKDLIPANQVKTDKRIDITFRYLLELIEKNIRLRHKNIQDRNTEPKVTIKFQEIREIINNNYDSASLEYATLSLKKKFFEISNEYLEDEYSNPQSSDEYNKQLEILHNTINKINSLDNESFAKFCFKISPQNDIDTSSHDYVDRMMMNLLEGTGVQDAFFEIIKQLRGYIDSTSWTYAKKDSNGENIVYLPSTINNVFNPTRNARLVSKIFKTSQVQKTIDDIDKIITTKINLENLENPNFFSDIPEVEHGVDSELEQYNIIKPKKISLIDLEAAKGEFHNE